MPPIDPAALIERVASQQLGPDPNAPQPAPAPESQAAPPPVQAKVDPTPTATEAAVSAGAPDDESSRMSDDAILYEVGGRKLTPQQISSTFDRYRDLNFKHAEHSNVLKAVELMMQSGKAKDPDDVARLLVSMMKADQPNAQMGADADDRGPQGPDAEPDDDETWSAWERDNAATLPPGYKDMHKNMRALAQQNAQVLGMLKEVLSKSGQVADTSNSHLEEAKNARAETIRNRIVQNIDSTAQRLGLQDEHAQDFLIFAGERGYTMDDFIDPRLTQQVMGDFKNSIDTPEMQRLREIAQRRQAFTGSMTQTPAAATAATSTDNSVDPRIARIASSRLGLDG